MIRRVLHYLVRAAWIVVAALVVGITIISVGYAYREHIQAGSLPLMLMGANPSAAAVFEVALDAASALTCIVLAALIFYRLLRDNPAGERMAIFTSFMLLSFAVVLNSNVNALPESEVFWSLVMNLVGFLGAMLFVLFMLKFPDGRYVPRFTVWMPRLFILWFISWFFWPQYGPNELSNTTVNLLVAAWMMAALAAQVYRYMRVSNPEERQQIKWVAYSLMVVLGLELLSTVASAAAPEWEPFKLTPTAEFLLEIFANLIWLMFPLGIGIAILRYRLWEIDRLINKTLVYTVLTLILGSIYIVSVLGLQNLFTSLSGESSDVALVISTLGVAALFNPVRGQVQKGIDRRFYRERYDAGRILAKYGETVRSEVELERLGEQLIEVVEQTLQPETVSLWLVGSGAGKRSDEAAWRMLLELDER